MPLKPISHPPKRWHDIVSLIAQYAAVILLLLIFLHSHGWAQGIKPGSSITVLQPLGSNLHISCDNGCGGAASFLDNGAFTAGTTPVNLVGGVFNDSITNLTSGDAGAVRLTADRNMFINISKYGGAAVGAGNPFYIAPGTGAIFPVSGTFWQATQPVSGTFWQATQPISGTVAATESGTWTVQPGNTANTTAWLVTGAGGTFPVTGTFWQATQPVSCTTANCPQPALTKGTQGATGFSVQELKDAGRSRITFTADRVVPAASDTLVTFTKDVAGTATTSQTTYSVTAGKTFRVQSIHLGVAASTTTALSVRLALRENTGGTCAASSAPAVMLNAATPAAVAAEGSSGMSMPFPDGLEFPAADSICLSAIGSTATGTITVTVVGYEY